MTKKIKKLIVALLTLVMLFGTNISAFAGSNGGNGNSGSIWTTNGAGKPVDQNIYNSKDDVYLNGGPAHGGPGFTPGDQYLVRVIEPGGKVLGMSTEFVTVDIYGRIPAKQLSTFLKTASSKFTLPGYDDTSNSGGEYQVEIGNIDSAGVFKKDKSDNFKVSRGTLTITKVVPGEGNDPTEFQVLIEGIGFTFSKTYTIKEGTPTLIEGLVPGTYKVTELQNDNYTTQAPNTVQIIVGAGSWTHYLTFTNEPIPQPLGPGTLTIKKNVDNINNDPTVFEVKITGVAPTVYNNTVNIKEGSPAVINLLPEGDYEVRETGDSNYITDPNNPKFVHIGGTTKVDWNVSIEFINSMRGTLTISKNVDNVNNDPTEFDVTITGVSPTIYNNTVKIKEGTPVTIPDMPEGDYLVTETTNSNYITKLPNPKSVHIGGTAESDWNISIEFINSKTGTLSIQKEVDNIPYDSTYFDVTITGPNNYTHTVKISEHPEAAKVMLTGLEEGWYTVTELPDPLYSVTLPNPKRLYIGDDVEGYTWYGGVRFTNTKLPEPLGAITINKNVDNVDNDPTEFEVIVTGLEGSPTYKVKEGTPTYIRDLPEGTYILTEKQYTGYTIKSQNPVTVVIGDNDRTVWYQSVTFTNTKNIIPPPPPPSFTGSITINKDVNNVDNDPTEFKVTITGPLTSTAVIKEGSPAVISGLPAGTYTITEQMPDGYTNVNGNPIVMTIGQDNWNGSATFVNQKTLTPPENETPGGPVVPDEEVPVGPPNLPATGELPPALFYLIGAAVISIGTIIRKR